MHESYLSEVTRALRTDGFMKTNPEALGIGYNQEVADEIVRLAPTSLLDRIEDDSGMNERRISPDVCGDLAVRLFEPIVNRLWSTKTPEWSLFGMNHYEEGAFFRKHQDKLRPQAITTIVLSLSGVRRFTITGQQPMIVEPQAIVLLDGRHNPEHQATCIEGTSVSIVADITASLQ